MQTSVITVKDVYKRFGKLEAVKGLSFEVPAASCFGLLGPNGAGKTTMMKMVYGRSLRDNAEASTIDVFGYDPRKHELDIKYISGVVPQENNLDEELNVKQNLIVYSKFYGLSYKRAIERINYLLDFLELSDKLSAKIRELSGGMKRRLVIARALLNEPQLLILDEPTTGLDPQVRHLIWDKLRQLKKNGITILLTTHYMEEAFEICDKILIMHRGAKIMEGGPRELMSEHIEKNVLEIAQKDVAGQVARSFDKNAIRVDSTHEVTLIYCNEYEKLKNAAAHLSAGQYHLRPSNLEDLFLRATGRGLNEAQ